MPRCENCKAELGTEHLPKCRQFYGTVELWHNLTPDREAQNKKATELAFSLWLQQQDTDELSAWIKQCCGQPAC